MDANHFRQRAARAREMATSGDDPRLSQMLLEVARDLDIEAESIDAEVALERRQFSRQPGQELAGLLVCSGEPDCVRRLVQVINISRGGAKLRAEVFCQPGIDVTLHLPSEGLRLSGRIIHTTGLEVGMAFDPTSRQDPVLGGYLQSRSAADAAHVHGVGKPAAPTCPASESSDTKTPAAAVP